LPTQTASHNYTAAEVAALGGVEAVWNELYNRLWTEYLGALRDGRPYVIHIRRHPPSPVMDSDPPQTTFALRAYYCLANPWMAEVEDVVDPSCMPRSDIDEGPPKTTTIAGRRFVRTDEGWQRMAD
jgi:hypothetical protein